MKKLLFLALALSLGLSYSIGCSGTNNQADCVEYATQVNSLDCITEAEVIDISVFCPESLIDECDLSQYYRCLQENTYCDGDTLVTTGTEDCVATCEES